MQPEMRLLEHGGMKVRELGHTSDHIRGHERRARRQRQPALRKQYGDPVRIPLCVLISDRPTGAAERAPDQRRGRRPYANQVINGTDQNART